MRRNRRRFVNKAFATFIGVLLVGGPVGTKLSDTNLFSFLQMGDQSQFKNWVRVPSQEGRCSAAFPKTPEKIQQNMPMRDQEKDLQYHVFVADHQRKEVFMVLIAQYPGVVSEEFAVKNLEHFLNTLIAQNHKNRLLFADLVSVQGFPGMDFHIRTDEVYFKGRVIQANNTLYLLAMECEIANYSDDHFNYFIESFQLDFSKES